MALSSTASRRATLPCAGRSRASTVRVAAAAWTKVSTKADLASKGGKEVVEVGGQKVLLASLGEEVFAVSNKCSHLGLPIVGKTAMFQGEVKDKCVVCPAHGTFFDLKTGEVVGEWCPKLPNLPLIGKGPAKKALPTFQVRVGTAGEIEVLA